MHTKSPRWPTGIKRIALVASLIVIGLVIFQVRLLLIPLLMSVVVAYLLFPIVQFLHNRLYLPRVLAISLAYISIVGLMVWVSATATNPLISQVNRFIDALPGYLEQGRDLLEQPIVLWNGQEVTISQYIPQEFDLSSYINSLSSFGIQGFNLFGSVASRTAIGIGWVVFTLFVSFYLVKDHEIMVRYVVSLLPEEYEWEIYQLFYELGDVWNAFLRGQIILFLVMGTTVFALATIIGLPNALFLGILAGFAEFVPHFGPMAVTIPAVLIAFFQTDQSWLGSLMSPAAFAILVGLGYATINQAAAYLLQPRVMGRSLNMHPLIVFIAALAGALVAGVVGILLASPLLASARAIFRYIYRKLRDIPPYPYPGQTEAEPTVSVRKVPERAVAKNDTSPPKISLDSFPGSRFLRAIGAQNSARIKAAKVKNGNGSTNGAAESNKESLINEPNSEEPSAERDKLSPSLSDQEK